MTNQQILAKFSSLVMAEGLSVKNQDIELGIANAESVPDKNIWTGYTTQNIWNIRIENNTIIALATMNMFTQNIFGATTNTSTVSLGNETHDDYGWYWNVRDGLEELCGGKFNVIVKQENGRKSTRKKNDNSEELKE
jgi:hypothetical protein